MLYELKLLAFQDNNFIGPLFEVIENLPSLGQILGAYNAFTGGIPDSIGSMRNLTIVGLGVNQLPGIIPPTMFSIASLQASELIASHFKEVFHKIWPLNFLS